MTAKFVFVREDASVPSLAPLYQGPYLVLERQMKFARLQLGTGSDIILVDRLKPAFSNDPIWVVLPPARGRLVLCAPDPALVSCVF